MNWKAFTAVLGSCLMTAFPQNIIGCGGELNPYDYYSSFFHYNLPDAKGYTPFYYTGDRFLFEENEPAALSDILATEWVAYTGNQCSKPDALKFVNRFAWKDLNTLYFHLEKNQPLKIPDSVKRNSMTDYFMKSKDLEALGYLMYAKKTEPFAVGDVWDMPNRDSLKMDKLIKNGRQLYSAAKKDIFKLKYAYQVLRMAHYSSRYSDVISWYDEYSSSITAVNSVLQPLCLSLRAGALFRTGSRKEAACAFSKVFSSTQARRISNYLGFVWSISRSEDRQQYLACCRSNSEKADMLGLFALSGAADELKTMEELYAIAPGHEMLEVLATREINKLEERWLTPLLQQQPGGKSLYGYWRDEEMENKMKESAEEVKALAAFLHKVAQSGKSSNSGLFETGAAYTAYMQRDFDAARRYMAAAEKMTLTPKVKDQLMLTGLLVTISSAGTIDAAFEEQLLPGVQWLEAKAKADKPVQRDYFEVSQWSIFYRNLMTDVLAKRYHSQNNLQKEALCLGAADKLNFAGYGYSSAVEYFRKKFTSTDVEKMFALMDSKNLNRFEKYLLGFNTITRSAVTEFAGTAYLRDYNYSKAAEWFSKTPDKKNITINTNPFVDLLYDREERLPAEAKFSTTKLAFAQEMQQLLQKAASDKASAAKHYYKYALGLYNMTYYGHAWQLVEYGRSGSDGYYIPEDATSFQKEYYGCYAALSYFEKAMNAAADKNFKARCLFMMGKCSQKQVRQPQYKDFPGTDGWDKYDAAGKDYWPRFKNNRYFPQLVKEYSSTPFYKEAYNSCSYLRDFVNRR